MAHTKASAYPQDRKILFKWTLISTWCFFCCSSWVYQHSLHSSFLAHFSCVPSLPSLLTAAFFSWAHKIHHLNLSRLASPNWALLSLGCQKKYKKVIPSVWRGDSSLAMVKLSSIANISWKARDGKKKNNTPLSAIGIKTSSKLSADLVPNHFNVQCSF